MQTILETPTFRKDTQRAGLTDTEVQEIVAFIAANPEAGALISGSGGARKVRFAREGGGKSGGYRTIHYFTGIDVPIFLLALIDKHERANLTKAERNALAATLPMIAEAYRRRNP